MDAPPRLRVLLVEDNHPDVVLVRACLEEESRTQVEITAAGTLGQGLERLAQEEFDAVLLDLSLPDAVGLEALEGVIADHEHLPVVVFTGLDDLAVAESAMRCGAQDYLVKGRLDGYHISRALWNAIERKRKEERIRRAAFFDELTGLPNRSLLLDRIERSIARGRREPDRRFALLYLDVDRFKQINDTFGHHAGDRFLGAVADRLRSFLRPEDTVARLGGDEFVLLLTDVRRNRDVVRVADRIHAAMRAAFEIDGQQLTSSVSIGIALVSSPSRLQAADALRHADTALYRAKARGRGCTELFDARMHEQVLDMKRLEEDLRGAVERDELEVHYQPIVNLGNGRVGGFEALLRWPRPDAAALPPLEFLPLAEETGLIHAIHGQVLRKACGFLRDLPAGGEELSVNVNLSTAGFRHPELYEDVAGVLAEHGIRPQRLHLEVREASLAEETQASERMRRLKQLGVGWYVDDFGDGHVSLAALERLPLEGMKIARHFVHRAWRRGPGPVRSILFLALDLGLNAVAAGIETEAQLRELRELGCPAGQGFLLGRPMQPEQASALVAARNCGRATAQET